MEILPNLDMSFKVEVNSFSYNFCFLSPSPFLHYTWELKYLIRLEVGGNWTSSCCLSPPSEASCLQGGRTLLSVTLDFVVKVLLALRWEASSSAELPGSVWVSLREVGVQSRKSIVTTHPTTYPWPRTKGLSASPSTCSLCPTQLVSSSNKEWGTIY